MIAETYRTKNKQIQESLTAQKVATVEHCGQTQSLILRISTAADYFTTDDSLMRDVPDVKVDISMILSFV